MSSSANAALIIDDDPDVCHLLVKALAANNIRVATAHTLQEAEECLKKIKPKLVLLDNNLPDGLGIDFIKRIKSFDKKIKVIMITGDTSNNIRERAQKEGIHSFLSKPFSMETIRRQADIAMQTIGN